MGQGHTIYYSKPFDIDKSGSLAHLFSRNTTILQPYMYLLYYIRFAYHASLTLILISQTFQAGSIKSYHYRSLAQPTHFTYNCTQKDGPNQSTSLGEAGSRTTLGGQRVSALNTMWSTSRSQRDLCGFLSRDQISRAQAPCGYNYVHALEWNSGSGNAASAGGAGARRAGPCNIAHARIRVKTVTLQRSKIKCPNTFAHGECLLQSRFCFAALSAFHGASSAEPQKMLEIGQYSPVLWTRQQRNQRRSNEKRICFYWRQTTRQR